MSEQITITPEALPITRVTVFEDRAEVMRQATLSLPAGPQKLCIEGLTPLVVDRLVSAWFEPPPGAAAHIEDIHIQRRWVAVGEQPDDSVASRLRGLADQIQGAEQALEEARQRYTRALQQRTAVESLLRRYTRQVGRALWTEQGDPDRWSSAVERLSAGLSEADVRLHEARKEQWAAEEAVERLRDLVDGRRQQEQVMVTDVTLQISGDGGDLPLSLSSVVPCALWRPAHEAHLTGVGQTSPIASPGEGPRVAWQMFATVWQCTGEDWRDVELILSTARPGVGARLPDLRPDPLYLRTKSPEEQRTVVVAHRTQAVERDTSAVPGVDDGGEIRTLTPTGTVSVPSDGRPHRIAVGGFEQAAEVALVARPEVAAHVYLTSRLANPLGGPLLAGPVALLRDGAYVGTGDIGYIGGGETFDLSFGSDDRFTVRYDQRRHTEDRMIARNRRHFVQHVALSFTGAEATPVVVTLRMPVSELKQVRVVPSEAWCSQGRPEPDADGLVTLPLHLHPGSDKEITLGFHFETSGSVSLPDPW